RLDLDAVLCLHRSPAVYFKEVARIDPPRVRALHRQFWNQSLAPVLVLIDPHDIYVFSGLTPPLSDEQDIDESNCLVKRLGRIADAAELRQLVLSIESGAFFRRHHKYFDPKQRVDKELLRNLTITRNLLRDATNTDSALKFL